MHLPDQKKRSYILLKKTNLSRVEGFPKILLSCLAGAKKEPDPVAGNS